MTQKTCLRCDWQGETNESICPNCERPLYFIGASPPEGTGVPARDHPAERSREAASTERKASSGIPTIHATPRASQMDPSASSSRLRRSTEAFVLAALVLIAALGTWFNAHEDRSASAGLTDAAITETPASDSSASPSTAASSQGSKGQPGNRAPKRVRIGHSITLYGNEDRLRIEVKVVQVVDPARPTDSVFGPEKGNHFVAVQLELTNSGAKTYSDTPSTGAVLIDNKLHQYDSDITDPVGPGFGSPKIAPGENRAGYITFEVPDGRTPIIFQFRLYSGFGRGGLWSL